MLLFTADDGVHGFELWRSDGTEAGTTLVSDINTGNLGSAVQSLRPLPGIGRAVFAASDGLSGVELWATDGSAQGLTSLADIASGPGSSNPFALTLFAGKLFCIADDGTTGPEPWTVTVPQQTDLGQIYLPAVRR